MFKKTTKFEGFDSVEISITLVIWALSECKTQNESWLNSTYTFIKK